MEIGIRSSRYAEKTFGIQEGTFNTKVSESLSHFCNESNDAK